MRLWSGWDALGIRPRSALVLRENNGTTTSSVPIFRNGSETAAAHTSRTSFSVILIFGGDGDYRLGPGAELMAGYGVCQSEERDKSGGECGRLSSFLPLLGVRISILFD